MTVLGAINVGTYYFFFGAFGGMLGMEDTITTRISFLAVLTGVQALINHFGIGLTAEADGFLRLSHLRHRHRADGGVPRLRAEL